ncbi:MAG: DndE family protein [bacterium]
MNLRLKTTNEIETLLVSIQSTLQVSTKAAVIRLAIAFSLNQDGDPRKYNEKGICYDSKNQDGLDYMRHTLLGDDDLIYKIMCQQHLKENLDDSAFFPDLINAHIERGITLLNSEIRYCNSKDKFLKKVLKGCEI